MGVETGRTFAPEDAQPTRTTVEIEGKQFHRNQLLIEDAPIDVVHWVVVECRDTPFGTAVTCKNAGAWDRERTITTENVDAFDP
jgi:hypothetical protein